MSEESLDPREAEVTATTDVSTETTDEPTFNAVAFFEQVPLEFESIEQIEEAKRNLFAWPRSFETLRTHVLGLAESGQPSTRLGLGFWLLGYSSKAAETLSQAGEDLIAYYLWAHALLESGRYQEAADQFSELARTKLKERRFLFGLAESYRRLDDLDNLEKTIGRLEKLDDVEADLAYFRGAHAERQGEYREAIEHYRKSIHFESEHSHALFRLAYRLDLEGEDEEAMDIYEQCLECGVTYVNAAINLGVLLEDAGRFRDAMRAYQRVLHHHPNHPRAKLFFKDAESSLTMFYDEDQERKEDKRNQILRIPVTDFELSVRSRNCLAKMNIVTLGDLIKKTEAELLSYKNFGETSLAEIKDILGQKGLRLGMAKDEDPAPPGTVGPVSTGGGDETVLGKPISELELSIRSRKAMDRLNLKTIHDLTLIGENELMSCPNFGQTSLNEIKQKLAAFNLRLKG
ncbi:MAG: DNA-directed RNA polymerase subunit alpha C-terminal domain-containing protein [Planctomycetota bacterium]